MTNLQKDIERLTYQLYDAGYIGDGMLVTRQQFRIIMLNRAIESKLKNPRFPLHNQDPSGMWEKLEIHIATGIGNETAHFQLTCIARDTFNRVSPAEINIQLDGHEPFLHPIALKDDLPKAVALLAYYKSPLPYKDFHGHIVPLVVTLEAITIDNNYSQNALAFSAELHIDGIKVARVYNANRATNPYPSTTNILPTDQGGAALIDQAEAWCRRVPLGVVANPLTLCTYIRDLLHQHAVEVIMPEQFLMFKDMADNIVSGVPGSSHYSLKKTELPIRELLKTPEGKASLMTVLANHVKSELSLEMRILNNNIPLDLLLGSGIRKEQLMKYPTHWKLKRVPSIRLFGDDEGSKKKHRP